MIEIKDTPAITEVGYCKEPETDREIEIEIMLFDRPVFIHGIAFFTIVRTTYTDTKVVHGMELYQHAFTNAQCTEAIKNISANSNGFKLNANNKKKHS